MRRIHSWDFHEYMNEDPQWAATLTEPVTVMGGVVVWNSPLTHISPLLTFEHDDDTKAKIAKAIELGKPRRDQPPVASFKSCLDLKTVAGNFHGAVDFENCGIETIDPEFAVHTLGTPEEFKSVKFEECHWLKTIDLTQCQVALQVLFRNCLELTSIRAEKKENWGSTQHPQIILEKCPKLAHVPDWFVAEENRAIVSISKKFRKEWNLRKRARTQLKADDLLL